MNIIGMLRPIATGWRQRLSSGLSSHPPRPEACSCFILEFWLSKGIYALFYRFRALITLAFVLPLLTGCLLRTHKVERRLTNAPPMAATLEELVARINRDAGKISSLNATVDIVTAAGGEKKGKVTEYQEIRGYVLVRKPTMLRMIGLFPVVRNRMFDMVSDGNRFKLSIPPKNKFIVGSNKVTGHSDEPLANLTPDAILDSLLPPAVDPKNEIAVLESGEEEVKDPKTKQAMIQPAYLITIIRRNDEGQWVLSRKILFSRTDLTARKQTLYDSAGDVTTVATYENFTDYNGVTFPSIIQILRPQEEYSIQLGMVKVRLNEALKDDQFQLAQPAGSQLQNLDTQRAEPPQRTQAVQPNPNESKHP
jgi:outer membrane lipoprotein-sorting protein